ncbi:MAG: hypothetical protein HY901_36410 [Deltaproteobacteria bacterium]|nr:hypothetical protein [Deltaproteobacteria bacterium]
MDKWARRLEGDYYALLSLDHDAERNEAFGRGRRCVAELEALLALPLSEDQRAAVSSARARIDQALAEFASPAQRAAYDATIGNFRGILRCMSEGLRLDELRQLRGKHLSTRPRNETAAMLKAVSAIAHLKSGQLQTALAEYEAALALDPLNRELFGAYIPLKRRLTREREEGS